MPVEFSRPRLVRNQNFKSAAHEHDFFHMLILSLRSFEKQQLLKVRLINTTYFICILKKLNLSLRSFEKQQPFNSATHEHDLFYIHFKKIELERAIVRKVATCQRITSKNTRTQWVDTWARDTVSRYWSAETVFWQLSINQNIGVQYQVVGSHTS